MSEYHRQLKSYRWQATRLRVFDRDGYRCQRCGKAGRLECHHITPLHVDPGQDFYKLDGLLTLCRKCHIQQTRIDRGMLKPRSPFDKMLKRLMR